MILASFISKLRCIISYSYNLYIQILFEKNFKRRAERCYVLCVNCNFVKTNWGTLLPFKTFASERLFFRRKTNQPFWVTKYIIFDRLSFIFYQNCLKKTYA